MSWTAPDFGAAVVRTRNRERVGMANNQHDEHKAGVSEAATGEPVGGDPRATEHPTGPKQAAENAANESPS
jgi:hypothetical protein